MGVKALWKLLTPVGRPIQLETIEGKVLAIDSSIWIYQFQATMRDKDGKLFVNAHVLGFLRRICKLLFYGIKPVFVFDGGAPTLKRSTINERKRKKSGAATTHAKVAERLLAAQMRREAVEHVQQKSAPKTSKGKGKAPQGHVIIDDDAVYLEDLDDAMPKTPAKPASVRDQEPGSSSKKKSRFHDHDPYHLPDVDFEQAIAKATRSTAPDPRLATEEEMREFISEMRPEDFDVSAPEFRQLPTEIQYEIIGDLRLKSRQTSYKRLQNMLKNAPTPLDFSKEQIKNLKQRNSLTQQLLITTDSIGKAHVEIPIRIASERNREYLLIKNEGEHGGWILGKRDEGTQAKPIVVDADHKADTSIGIDSDEDMEEVAIPRSSTVDPHLREYRRDMALSALSGRLRLPAKPLSKLKKPPPLFGSFEDDELQQKQIIDEEDEEEDPVVSLAIRESLELQEASDLQQALDTSRHEASLETPKRPTSSLPPAPSEIFDEDELYASPGRLATALSIAGAGPSASFVQSFPREHPSATVFGRPGLLLPQQSPSGSSRTSDEEMEEVVVGPPVQIEQAFSGNPTTATDTSLPTVPARFSKSLESPQRFEKSVDKDGATEGTDFIIGSSDFLEAVIPGKSIFPGDDGEFVPSDEDMEEVTVIPSHLIPTQMQGSSLIPDIHESSHSREPPLLTRIGEGETNVTAASRFDENSDPSFIRGFDEDSKDEPLTDWSRSPSPQRDSAIAFTPTFNPPVHEDDNWDAAQEMDPDAEQGEFARFMSQMKGRDLDDVRKEIEEEIQGLKQQQKAAMRDSDDITQQMISQIMIMLRLFGIPYMTAPMEAEAQCAQLVSLGLVEGIITDDSDVFLFGGNRVFKHMFNQSKTVECFLASDLKRELGLDRDALIRLAYLLGSDYVDGLTGVGPVVAMELMKEFPGTDGLHKFKDWWTKVQSGKDKPEDNRSKFRKRFKKKFKDLYLPTEWPNPAVRDAYYHPTVDESEEPFKWGLPDLDGLRGLFLEELGWRQEKVDDLLLPIVQRVGKRRQAAALNKQGNLDEYLEINAVGGNHRSYAPRKRQAYASKRLQQVVTDYRDEQKRQRSGSPRSTPSLDERQDQDEENERPSTKKRKRTSSLALPRYSTTGRGRRRGRRPVRRQRLDETDSDSGEKSSSEDFTMDGTSTSAPAPPLAAELRPRPRPRPVRRAQHDNDEV